MSEYFIFFGTYLLTVIGYVILAILEFRKMDHRHNFAIRVIACLAVSLAVCAVFSYLSLKAGLSLSPYLSLLFDLVMYIVVIISVFFLISQNNSTRFFLCSVIFLGHAVCLVIENVILSILAMMNIFPSTYIQWGMRCLVFILSFCYIYFLFAKNFLGKTEQVSSKFTSTFLWLFLLVSTMFEAAGVVISYKDSQFSLFLNLAYLFYIIIMTSFFYSMMKAQENETVLSIIKQLWNEDRKQYQIQKENMDIINIKCHDLRHQIQNYRDTNKQGVGVDSMMKQLENSIYIYDAVIKTGNEVLDVILSNISLRCQKKNVQLTCMVDGKILLFMEEADTYSLFGNMLDNALEYEEKVQEESNRFISLTVKKVHSFAHIHCENYFQGKDKQNPKNFLTTKKDTVNHGFGLKSMEQIANKYSSKFDVIVADDMFQIDIMIPLHEEITHEKEQ